MDINELCIETNKVFEIFRKHFGETDLSAEFIMDCFDESNIPAHFIEEGN